MTLASNPAPQICYQSLQREKTAFKFTIYINIIYPCVCACVMFVCVHCIKFHIISKSMNINKQQGPLDSRYMYTVFQFLEVDVVYPIYKVHNQMFFGNLKANDISRYV